MKIFKKIFDKFLLRQCIKHYERMILKIENIVLPIDLFSNQNSHCEKRTIIEKLIKENWTGVYCACCGVYRYKICIGCPLDEVNNCNFSDSVWGRIDAANSKEELLTALNNMLIVLRNRSKL